MAMAMVSVGCSGDSESKQSAEKPKKVKFKTSITRAAYKGDLATIKKMVEAGVDINKKTSQSMTALMSAAQAGKIEVVKYLISQGADLYVEDIYHNTADNITSDDAIAKLIRDAMKKNPKKK
jgi:ankyrin repeat protein